MAGSNPPKTSFAGSSGRGFMSRWWPLALIWPLLLGCREDGSSGPAGTQPPVLSDDGGISAVTLPVIERGVVERLRRPVRLAYASERLYVTDSVASSIFVLAPNRRLLDQWRGLPGPLSLAVHRGELLVGTEGDGTLYRVSLDGEVLGVFGGASASFERPTDIAVAEDGTVAVCDAGSRRVVLLSPDGDLKGELAEPPGGMRFPACVAADPVRSGWLVCDQTGHRVLRYDAQHRFVGSFGTVTPEEGSGPKVVLGTFARLADLAVTAEGDILALDSYHGHIQRFDSDGRPVDFLDTSAGGGPGLRVPLDLALGPDGLFVANHGHGDIFYLQIPASR